VIGGSRKEARDYLGTLFAINADDSASSAIFYSSPHQTHKSLPRGKFANEIVPTRTNILKVKP
jgi:hypothetical protein